MEAETSRASRRERISGRGIRLRDRDVEILLAIAKMRLVRTTELTRLFFEAKGTCQKRLRKLYDAGLIRAVVTDLASENRYAITRLGHTFLENALEEDMVPAFRAPPRVERRGVVHLDLLNAYRVGLAVGGQQHGIEVVRFRSDWELMAENPQARLVPDALILLRAGGHEICVAVEVDTGTEARHIVKNKLIRYAEIHANRGALLGVEIDVLLFVIQTCRRARSIAKLLMSSSPAKTVLLGVPPDVTEAGGLVSGLWTAESLVTGIHSDGKEGIVPGYCRLQRVV